MTIAGGTFHIGGRRIGAAWSNNPWRGTLYLCIFAGLPTLFLYNSRATSSIFHRCLNVAMEKEVISSPAGDMPYQLQRPSRPRRIVASALFMVAALWLMNSDLRNLLHFGSHQPSVSEQHPHKTFDWDDVKTSPHLQYTPCHGDLQCARLELPMDWFNHTTNATISLAVVRQPAVVPRHTSAVRRCCSIEPRRTRWLGHRACSDSRGICEVGPGYQLYRREIL